MRLDESLDQVFDMRSKVRILRLFLLRSPAFMASGREIAKMTGFSPPAMHAALKELHAQNLLKRDIIGKQHIYRLNLESRIINEILLPAFQKEQSIKADIGRFLVERISANRALSLVISLILYGSVQHDEIREESDCDIAVIAKDGAAKITLEGLFLDKITNEFYEYFGIHLDPYLKTQDEFRIRMKKRRSPIPTLLRNYTLLYGKDPSELGWNGPQTD